MKNLVPQILSKKHLLQSNIFRVEQLEIKFNNGVKMQYERMLSSSNGAVLIIAIKDNCFVLIKEYAVGMERYELTFAKGKVDDGETWQQATERESQEELGFLPNSIKLLKTVSLASSYMTHRTHIVLAENLIISNAVGDEPEPLEIIYWPVNDWQELIAEPSFSEGRSFAAILLYLTEKNLI
jgi:ADP-ribose diphosphatase